VFQKKIESDHSKEQEYRIGTSFLGEADMISHKGKGKRAWNRNRSGELPREKIGHRNGKGTKDEWDDAKVPLGVLKGIEKMGK